MRSLTALRDRRSCLQQWIGH